MRRYPLALLATLLLAMVGDHAVLAQNANAPQDNCDPSRRKDNPDLQRHKDAKKAQLRARGYPERFMKLIDREECIACVDIASDAFHIMIVYKDNDYAPTDYKTGKKWTHVSHLWDPETEVLAREKTKDGTIKGFYILNTLTKGCRCCGDTADGKTSPQSYSDWDEDLGANKDHLIPFDESNLGPLPDDLVNPSDKWVGDPLPVVETFTKPAKKQAHAPCKACEGEAAKLNAAYDAVDSLWNDKIAKLDAREVKEVELARAQNEIRLLWYRQRSATLRSAANQARIEELEAVEKKLKDEIRAGAAEVEAIDAKIAAQQPTIAALEKGLLECQAKCATTLTDAQPAVVNTAPAPPRAAIDPPPPPPAATLVTALPASGAEPVAKCPQCESLFGPLGYARKELASSKSSQAIAAWQKNVDDTLLAINRCNAQCYEPTTVAPPPLPPRETFNPPACFGDSCTSEWSSCEATGTCPPVEKDCGIPGTCSDNPGKPDPTVPYLNLADAMAWGPAANVDVEVRIQEKIVDIVDPPPCSAQPAANERTFCGKVLYDPRNQSSSVEWRGYSFRPDAPRVWIPPTVRQGVEKWFNPLGLLARRLLDHVDRWRGSLGPRPFLTTRDLDAIDRATGVQAAGLPGGLHILLTDQGGSTGKTLSMQILNFTGREVALSSRSFVVQPIKQQAQQQVQQAFGRLARSAPFRLDLNAYCVEFLKAPPAANTLLKLAPANVQQKYAAMSKVLQSAYRVHKAGALRPDSNPAAYTDSIKQWAIWAVEQKLNESRYTDAFLGHTKKNVEAAGQQWSKPAEDMVRKVSPNRWRDIVKILQGAGVPVPQ